MRHSTTRTHSVLFSLACFVLLARPEASAEEYILHNFTRTQLDDDFYCEGASFGDLTGDGVNELISGPFWYEGPDYKKRHEFYPPRPFDPKGYSNNFFVFVHDFNGDARNDILVIGFPGKDASWFENPGDSSSGHWTRHVVFDTVDNESPTFADLTGDGRPELIAQTAGRFGYALPDWEHPEKKWRFVAISEDRKLGRFTHGLGFGDVDGDGRRDVLERGGWYRQPESLEGDPLWDYHPYPFSGPGGAQMYVYDIDGDGDGDVITSLAAHGFGLAWYEQFRNDGKISFKPHVIMPGPLPERATWENTEHAPALEPDFEINFSNLHAIDLVDMDGDGLEDIVTGKRFWAHFNEKESGGIAVSYWFKLTREKRDDGSTRATFVPYMIDDDSGVGTQVVAGDVNGDGLPDLVVGNKKGTFYIEHAVEKGTREEWLAAQPKRARKDAAFHRGALSPERSAAVMTVPDGFRVDLIAGEPDLHQPVAFAIDERGRLWVVEAFTYPKRSGDAAGKWNEGQDKIIVLEDGDGDGRYETRRVFVEGLNLVSGLEIGHGGVFVGAAPYLLFFADANRDDRADGDPEILLDGFGFQDTHETLNSFIWGPDGWLYGCHGVFTHSRVGKPGTPDAERIPVNAAYWRFHPVRREFDVFAWGTSNPWGIDFNDLGQAFSTACVIPHLYHVIQGARYQRQAGRHFNAHVYDDIKTIADHRHYAGNIRDHAWWGKEPQAPKSTLDAGGGHAHCGAMIYLGDSFPESYRDKLFMNNIHGNRVNCDILERRGSGYVGRHGEDLVITNHARYRGINLKYGPDGSVFFIDWHDHNACHRTLPEIWDRSNGRMYRLSHGEPRPDRVDLSKLSDAELVELQLHRNDWYVRTARRLLQERGGNPAVHTALARILRSHPDVTRKLRALWALHVTSGLSEELALEQLSNPHEHLRAWTIQCALETGAPPAALRARLAALAKSDPSAVVRLYLASALQRLPVPDRAAVAEGLVAHAEDADDHNLPLLIWYGIEPIAAREPDAAMAIARASRIPTVTRYITRRVAANVSKLEPIMSSLSSSRDAGAQALVLSEMLEAFKGHADVEAPPGWEKVYGELIESGNEEVRELAQAVAVRFGDRRVFPLLRSILADGETDIERRRQVLGILIDGKDDAVVPVLQKLVAERELRRDALRALAAFGDPETPAAILRSYGKFNTEERNDAINTLSSRVGYGLALIAAVERGDVPRKDLSAFTVRQLRSLGDEKLNERLNESWGVARETAADKLEEIARYKKLLANAEKPRLANGRAIYNRVCAQCHTLFGAGSNIAPDLTGSNRADLDYILENLLDPNAVVGKDYQMHVLLTRDGRAVTGLITKDTDTALTVKTINDEVVIAKRMIRSKQPSTSSLMPEGLLGELSREDVRDLIAYLGSPKQVFLPGASVSIDTTTRRVAGALEGEKLPRKKPSRGDARSQSMKPFGEDEWSANEHLWWTGARPGDTLEITFPVERKGVYAVDVALTRAPDYGVVQLSLDGRKVESPIDLYDPKVVPTGTLRLGELELEAGEHTLGVEIVGANPKARKSFLFGLDYVLLTKLE